MRARVWHTPLRESLCVLGGHATLVAIERCGVDGGSGVYRRHFLRKSPKFFWSWRRERVNGNGMAEWRNGGMMEWRMEWQNGGMAEWRNGQMVIEWRSGRMVMEWRNGVIAEWWNGEWRNGGMADGMDILACHIKGSGSSCHRSLC